MKVGVDMENKKFYCALCGEELTDEMAMNAEIHGVYIPADKGFKYMCESCFCENPHIRETTSEEKEKFGNADYVFDFKEENLNFDTEIDERCPHCDREVNLYWNIAEKGGACYCPYCGKELTLCSMCYHDLVDCSTCPFKLRNKREEKKTSIFDLLKERKIEVGKYFHIDNGQLKYIIDNNGVLNYVDEVGYMYVSESYGLLDILTDKVKVEPLKEIELNIRCYQERVQYITITLNEDYTAEEYDKAVNKAIKEDNWQEIEFDTERVPTD